MGVRHTLKLAKSVCRLMTGSAAERLPDWRNDLHVGHRGD
jgi:hypothetical protein